MSHASKPVLLYRCRHCGRDLELERLSAPALGLLRVTCNHCRHEHLFAPQELRLARLQSEQMVKLPPVGIPRFIDSLRRVISA